jgi:hypothetical protein
MLDVPIEHLDTTPALLRGLPSWLSTHLVKPARRPSEEDEGSAILSWWVADSPASARA